jgi:CheY-like chemotaxis protein
MKILVIDNTPANLASATQTLVGHELTLCDNVDAALELLNVGSHGNKIREEAPEYDVVLCDLLMTPGTYRWVMPLP